MKTKTRIKNLNDWRSIENDPPPENQRVWLGFERFGEWQRCICVMHERDIDDYTHWQPLPTDPELETVEDDGFEEWWDSLPRAVCDIDGSHRIIIKEYVRKCNAHATWKAAQAQMKGGDAEGTYRRLLAVYASVYRLPLSAVAMTSLPSTRWA